MTTTFTLPKDFVFVGAGLLSTVGLLVGQIATVDRWRKRSGIKYPQLYAEKEEAEKSKDAYIFNCAQRAHQNTLENIPIIYLLTVLTGLKYPIAAASACGLWTLSRISYTRGYVTGNPAKRGSYLHYSGLFSQLGLLVSSIYIVGQAVASSL